MRVCAAAARSLLVKVSAVLGKLSAERVKKLSAKLVKQPSAKLVNLSAELVKKLSPEPVKLSPELVKGAAGLGKLPAGRRRQVVRPTGEGRRRRLPAPCARRVLVKPRSSLELCAIAGSTRGHEPSSASPRVPVADAPGVSGAPGAPKRYHREYQAAPRAGPPLPYEVPAARQPAEQRRGHLRQPTAGQLNSATSSRCRRPDLHTLRERRLPLLPPSAADRRARPRRC